MGRPRLVALLLVLGLAGSNACKADDEAVLPQVDYEQFVARAYPVLMRDCAFAACHGNNERLFQVYGPGRARLRNPEKDDAFPGFGSSATPRELQVSFDRARSMLLHRGDLSMSPLLRKPVQGSAHFGIDRWKRNIYASKKAAGYVILKTWAKGVEASESKKSLSASVSSEDGGRQ